MYFDDFSDGVSINELLDMEIQPFTLILILAILFIILVPLVKAIVKKNKKDDESNIGKIYGDGEFNQKFVEEKNVKVIAKRTAPNPDYPAAMVNMIVFEFTNGNRVELAIRNPDKYGVILEGDCGTLSYRGKRFLDFIRNTESH